MSGNTSLVEYGIGTEASDMRAHVCVLARRVYIFDTEAARQAIATGRFRRVGASTGAIKTAEGYLVPPTAIPGCKSIPIPADWLAIERTDSTTVKGDKAMAVVARLAEQFGLPVPTKLQIVTSHREQIAGIDAVIEPPRRSLQVKCDFEGGNVEHGGTGNLFIQVAECNPYGRT